MLLPQIIFGIIPKSGVPDFASNHHGNHCIDSQNNEVFAAAYSWLTPILNWTDLTNKL